MIIAHMNGKIYRDRNVLASFKYNTDLKEIKDVDNHHCGDMFKIGARASFKRFDSNQKTFNASNA